MRGLGDNSDRALKRAKAAERKLVNTGKAVAGRAEAREARKARLSHSRAGLRPVCSFETAVLTPTVLPTLPHLLLHSPLYSAKPKHSCGDRSCLAPGVASWTADAVPTSISSIGRSCTSSALPFPRILRLVISAPAALPRCDGKGTAQLKEASIERWLEGPAVKSGRRKSRLRFHLRRGGAAVEHSVWEASAKRLDDDADRQNRSSERKSLPGCAKDQTRRRRADMDSRDDQACLGEVAQVRNAVCPLSEPHISSHVPKSIVESSLSAS
ncbi:hypothetical protein AAT19DRAFT_13013 [Rhodotorula toruloides]|uniref:Uncharacterized protein n=1 Tax=Rhodotorula toruloides TaxID=5286 RepID=A0A2T0ADB0_RHOTO|nr:hypothetical protein AAT19DRAFT_13013 [Rhodotorula toruloides]